MADSIIDFAGLDAAAAAGSGAGEGAGTIDVPEVDSGAGAGDGAGQGAGAGAGDGAGAGAGDGKQEGSEKAGAGDGAGAGAGEADKDKVEDLPGTEKTPQEIRKVLQAIKGADPKNATAVKQLHREFENSLAFKQVFPSVQEARDAKLFIESVGGAEGLAKMQDTLANVEAVDAKLYAGDPTLWDDLVDDLKESNHIDALGKLAPAFLQKLLDTDKKAYYETFAPHLLSGLTEVNMTGALAGLAKALENTDAAAGVTSAKQIVKGIQDWMDNLKGRVDKAKAAELDPERKKLNEERAAFAKQQEEFKTNQSKQFKDAVGGEADKENNRLLGTQLKSYLKMAFFKDFTRENLIPLGNNIKQELFDALKADQAYQTQMKALWGAKTPDRAKILEYHRTKVESLATDVVRRTVQRMYPGYAKGGAAAGRVAAAQQKQEVKTQAEKTAQATGKPIYVATKPKWEEIDWTKDPKQTHFIMGRAYLKSGKFVTWRK